MIPFSTDVLRISLKALELAKAVAKIGNTNALSDAGVAALTALAAAKAANFNILINLQSITDEDFRKKTLAEAGELIEKCVALNEEVEKDVCSRL